MQTGVERARVPTQALDQERGGLRDDPHRAHEHDDDEEDDERQDDVPGLIHVFSSV